MDTKTKRRLAPAYTSSDALLFDYIRKVELRLVRLERYVTVPPPGRRSASRPSGSAPISASSPFGLISTIAHVMSPPTDHEQKRAALGYLTAAWTEARVEGIDGDCLAQVCLFTAFAEFVSTYGEEMVARFAEGLAVRIRNGEFSLTLTRQ
jgi:hypothetical protein